MRFFPNKPLSAVWLKAAVLGSLWAAFEIIAGSFLHNLRLPFSGTFLTFSSVFLVIAFVQLWRDKGLVWRAGLICAMMKSLSPSAVIIGPMVGILTEALIIEVFIRMLGHNLLAYSIAGALAVVSALAHKVFTLLVLYGFNLVNLLEELYHYLVRQIGLTQLRPMELITGIIILYAILGIIASVSGYYAGRHYSRRSYPKGTTRPFQLDAGKNLFSFSSGEHYSLAFLFSHIVLIIMCLLLINTGSWYIFLPICLAYITWCFIRYRNSMKYLRKVMVWIHFVLITLLAAFLLEGYMSGSFFSIKGLIIGLKMNLRAFVIMTGFAAISTELKNPLIKSILYRKGLASLYQSLGLAFSALPAIIAGLPKASDLIRKRDSILHYLFSPSQSLLETFQLHHLKKPSVIMVTGETGQGKTTFTKNLVDHLHQLNIFPAGFLSPGIHEGEIKTGFELYNLSTGEKTVICSKSPREGWKRTGHYYFDTEIFKVESGKILNSIDGSTPLVVIDEAGPLEMNDGGWAPLITELCRDHNVPQLWVVRSSLAMKMMKKWDVGDVFIFRVDEDQIADVASVIMQIQSKKDTSFVNHG